ncbi:MAG: Xylose operon regulatory protein [Tenericutes bacterium ADurb.Bin239]|nr:MAG: Xylose operon regulatory protein [Tenericutes bacterium ADurb.Bin239]
MTLLDDLKYIITNLGNVSGLPVRLFLDEDQVFYYSTIRLYKDPFILNKHEAFNLHEDICYLETSNTLYYGIINYHNIKIVIGPTRQVPIAKQELRALAFSLSLKAAETDEFVSQMELLPSLSLMALLQMLCLVNYAVSGTKRTLTTINVHEREQISLKDEFEKERVRKIDEKRNAPYGALDIENRLLDMVMRGDVAALEKFMAHIPAVAEGQIAQEQLRHTKNIFVVTTTLVSRAAIRGGMDVTIALALSDAYIQKCELMNDIASINDLFYRLVFDYAENVEKLRFGQHPSILTKQVSNYIQQNLSKSIKVQDIAHALFMSRSNLSTNFKKETGINLSDFISTIKIDEAKRLLRYSDKTFTAIALYLGFSSHSHFTKVFKDKTQRTPKEYRQLHKHY